MQNHPGGAVRQNWLSSLWWVAFTLLSLLSIPPAAAQDQPATGASTSSEQGDANNTWAKAQASKELRWGADQEGGAPFIFPSDKNPDIMIGFEVEMAEKMATHLQVPVKFYQGQWDNLPTMLQANKIDFVMNGYEWLPDRLNELEVSIPYYVYALQLMVKKDGAVTSWDVFQKEKPDGDPWRIGVLSGSAAEEYMTELKEKGAKLEISSYDGCTEPMMEVGTGKIDATLQDTPIAAFYLKDFPKLQYMGDPVAPGYYVIYGRKGDTELMDQINRTLITMFRNGELKAIYERFGMWNKEQDELARIIEDGKFYGYFDAVTAEIEEVKPEAASGEPVAAPKAEAEEVEKSFFETLLSAAGLTILLSVISFPLAIILGLLIAVGRLYGPAVIRLPLTAYVEFLRGTPLMLQLIFIFFFLPEVGINIPAFPTAILGLAVNYSAYESEIYRAGLQAIPIGQMEAALSLGMSRSMAIRRIIVPQAVRIVIPPVVNDFIALFKDTSVCSVVTLIELTKQFNILARNNPSELTELMVITGLLYFCMSYPMSLVARHLEKTLAREAT